MSEPSSTRNGHNISDTFNIRYRYQGHRKEDLGRGAKACVYAAVYRDKAVAIKEFPADTPESKVEREIEFLETMRGEYYVVQYIGKFVNPERKLCLVMEVAYNFTVSELLRRTLVLSRELRIRLAREVCLGVRALHRKGIAHEDIKSDNVLLNFGLRAKVCDFGSAKFVSEDDYPAVSGTRLKKAPKKERGGPYDRLRSDIFSLGLLLKEVLRGLGSEFSALLSKCLSKEPEERPSCDKILAALPNLAPVAYSRFVNLDHTLNHLDESEKINISYSWTDFEPGEDSQLTEGRAFFFEGLYDEAFDYFRKVDYEELPLADVFLGIMKFHGLGPCEKDLTATRDHFERACENEDFEEDGRSVKALIYYYLAMVLMSIDPYGTHERARGFLHRLDQQGNSFGPALLARMHAQNLVSLLPGFRHSIIAKNLFRAAKAGYPAAEAYLTFFYIYYNSRSTMPAIPAMEMEYLKRSVEGGSALGRLLLDFVNHTIDEDELLQTKSPEIFIFVGSLYNLTGRNQLARRWFSEASTSGDGAAMMAAAFEEEGNSEEALVWLLKAKAYSEIHLSQGPAIAGVQYHSEVFQFSPSLSWQLRLAEKYLNQGRLGEARSLIAAVTADIKTWYDITSLKSFALKSESARYLVKEARDSLSDTDVFVLAFVYQQSGLRDEAVEWLEEGVKRGDTESLTTLGTIFYEEQNFDKARHLFEKGAEKGSVLAKYNLGYLERNYTMNYDRAVFYLEQAVSENFPPAMAALAELLVHIDKLKHLERAKKLYKHCSDLGHDNELWGLVGLFDCETDSEAEISYWLDRALRYVDFAVIAELGIAFDDISTPELVNKAAEKGTGQALFHKGMVLWLNLFGGDDEDDEDPEEAYKYFSTAAEKLGHIDSIPKCYIICEEKGDLDGVEKWKSFMEQRGLFSLVECLSKMS